MSAIGSVPVSAPVLVVVSVPATVPVSVLMSAFRVVSALAPVPEAALCFEPLSA